MKEKQMSKKNAVVHNHDRKHDITHEDYAIHCPMCKIEMLEAILLNLVKKDCTPRDLQIFADLSDTFAEEIVNVVNKIREIWHVDE